MSNARARANGRSNFASHETRPHDAEKPARVICAPPPFKRKDTLSHRILYWTGMVEALRSLDQAVDRDASAPLRKAEAALARLRVEDSRKRPLSSASNESEGSEAGSDSDGEHSASVVSVEEEYECGECDKGGIVEASAMNVKCCHVMEQDGGSPFCTLPAYHEGEHNGGGLGRSSGTGCKRFRNS